RRRGLFKLLDTRRHHLRQTARTGPAPIEAADELPVHQHPIALGDAVECLYTDRRVPGGDRQGEEALACLRNGEPELGDLVTGRHPALHRIRGDAARQYHDVHRDHGSPFRLGTLPTVTDTPVRDSLAVDTTTTNHPPGAAGIRTI